jgi:hypothetical protein
MQSLVAVAQFSILVLAAAIFLSLLVAYYGTWSVSPVGGCVEVM